jgi:hypothetical protein
VFSSDNDASEHVLPHALDTEVGPGSGSGEVVLWTFHHLCYRSFKAHGQVASLKKDTRKVFCNDGRLLCHKILPSTVQSQPYHRQA